MTRKLGLPWFLISPSPPPLWTHRTLMTPHWSLDLRVNWFLTFKQPKSDLKRYRHRSYFFYSLKQVKRAYKHEGHNTFIRKPTLISICTFNLVLSSVVAFSLLIKLPWPFHGVISAAKCQMSPDSIHPVLVQCGLTPLSLWTPNWGHSLTFGHRQCWYCAQAYLCWPVLIPMTKLQGNAQSGTYLGQVDQVTDHVT